MKWLISTRTGGKSSTSFIQGLNKLNQEWVGADPTAWKETMWCYNVDVAVIFGCRADDLAIRDSAKANGVPTVMVDLGYINRFNEAYRPIWDNEKTLCVSVGDLPGWVPSFTCKSDRKELLGIKYPTLKYKSKGDVLVIGQWPVDLCHPFRSMDAIDAWVNTIKERIPNESVKYRPHPRAVDYDIEFLEEAFLKAKCVVTWSSNTGHEALLEGIPVITVAGAYREITESLDNLEDFVTDPWFPDKTSWEDYFSRLAYGQWSFQEFENGLPQTFIKDYLEGKLS